MVHRNLNLWAIPLWILFWVGWPADLPATPAQTMEEAERQAGRQIEAMVDRIRNFHDEARANLRASIDLPLLTEYFSLDESRHNRHDPSGGILLTERQTGLRKRLEAWSLQTHHRFPIGETCLVDRSGQEHMRVVEGRVEHTTHFSDSEHGSPFFEPTFKLGPGEVSLSRPYMSSDVYAWVVAFTSPIILPDGSKPAFLHFEVPLAFYRELLSTTGRSFSAPTAGKIDHDEEGRFLILDERGLLLADNLREIDLTIKADRHPEKNPHLPDYLPPEKLEDYLPIAAALTPEPAWSQALAEVRAGAKGPIPLVLGGRNHILVHRMVPDRPWLLIHLDPVGGAAFWE